MSRTRGRVTLSGHVIDALWPSLRLFGLALLCGRILLSFLPAGEPGGHSLRKLPATLAASLLLGSGLLLALSYVSDPPWIPAALLGAAGGLLRWATLPAGIVPRHEPGREPAGWLARLCYLGALVPAFVAWPSEPASAEDAPDLLALELMHRVALVLLLVGVEHGLATARRAPLGRRLFVLALSLLFFRENPRLASISELVERIDAACIACGAAFALAWLRRADRRSAVLAAACFVIGRPWSSFDGVVLAAAAMLALVVCSARPSRGWIAGVSSSGLVCCFAPALRGMAWTGPTGEAGPREALLRLALALVVLASAAWILRAAAARSRPEAQEWREALARGDVFLILLLLCSAAVSWWLPASVGALEGPSGLQVVAPVAFLLAGCVAIRPERTA